MAKLFRERVAEARAAGFTPSFEKVAQYIEANVLRAALSTASKLARETGVDPATVVRMTQRLGYRGWPELRDELAAGIVEETDIITGTELTPLLQGRRQALEVEREALQEAIDKLDKEIEWIDKTLERCEPQ